MLGYSQAAENNKTPIADTLRKHLKPGTRVLEIGSGSGQHAIHMAGEFPLIEWWASEREEMLPILRANLEQHGSDNIRSPRSLDLTDFNWAEDDENAVDVVYAANIIHIVSQDLGTRLIHLAADALLPGGLLVLYGPYKYNGKFTTESNASFDQWLKDRDPASGIRDYEAVSKTAQGAGLIPVVDYSMPANNQMLLFERSNL